jgi:hypothetical protein
MLVGGVVASFLGGVLAGRVRDRITGLFQVGMLGVLAALAIPIIVHLMFGRRARRIDLGTLRFLKIVLSENVRRKQIKRWVLLALRLAAVALLAFPFARPYLVSREAGGEERLVILPIDPSASMGLRRGGERPIDAAVREARSVLANCDAGTRVEAPCFDHAVHPLIGPHDTEPSARTPWGLG